ncbi:MAG: leukotoxin LktA family filamentous adhesin [Candidatus Omnitrophica bacterium]|nr:leukotoxin LktA family filamentous adhesin [Candidatus Omnitrophota bacterium]
MQFHAPCRPLAYFLSIVLCLNTSPVQAGQIIPDRNTATSLETEGRVTDVRTSTIQGENAFNSFRKFDVYQDNVVNLHLPDGTSNLLNLVHSYATHIDGALNSIQDGAIGGNVFFANPHGMVVGETGSINVGALTAMTPTPQYMRDFFDSPGNPSAAAVSSLLNSTVPINENALISVQGQIHAIGDIALHAGKIANTGLIQSAVNMRDIPEAPALAIRNGEIILSAEQDVVNAGIIRSEGANEVDGGKIHIRAGRDIKLEDASAVSARGRGGNSDGGEVIILADRDAEILGTALVDVSGGEISGDGGFAEFSAEEVVNLNGGIFQAGATDGEGGNFLIDPDILNINQMLLNSSDATYFSGGNGYFEADEVINIGANTTISSRQIEWMNLRSRHLSDPSIGDSGNLTFAAPVINVGRGARILAHVLEGDTEHAAGDIAFLATDTDRLGFEKNAYAGISMEDAVLKGKNVVISALADTSLLPDMPDDSPLSSPEAIVDAIFDFTGDAVVTLSDATALVALSGDTQVEASGNVAIKAEAISRANPLMPGYLLGFAWGESHATAEALLQDEVEVKAGNAVELSAATENMVKVTARSHAKNKPVDVTFVKAETTAETTASIAEGVTVEAGLGGVKVVATTMNDVTATAEAVEVGASSAGIAVAVNELTTHTNALVAGQVFSEGNIEIRADAETKNNLTEAHASSLGDTESIGTQLNNVISGAKNKVASKVIGKRGADFFFPGIKSGKLNFAGSVAYCDSTNNANASIQGTPSDPAQVEARGNLLLQAAIEDNMNIHSTAKTSSDKVALGGAVVFGGYENNANAFIGPDSKVNVRGLLALDAQTEVPYPWEVDFSSFDEVIEHLAGGLENLLLTSYAFNSSKGKEYSLAGAVNLFDLDNTSNAYIDAGALVNSDPGYAGSEQAVSLYAHNDINSLNLVGMWSSKVLFGSTPKAALGGSYNQLNTTASANAYINEDAEVSASGDIVVGADSQQNTVTVTMAGGTAAKVGVEGALSNCDVKNTATAVIDDDAAISAGHDLLISADGDVDHLNITGGVVKAQNVGIGASVSINDVTSTVMAGISDRNTEAVPFTDNTLSAGNRVTVTATADNQIGAYSLAGTLATGGSSEPPADGEENKDSGKGKYGIAVSGDVSLNAVDADTLAFVKDGAGLSSGSDTGLSSTSTSGISAIAGSVAIATASGKSLGIAGSYAQNDLTNDTMSFAENATLDVTGDLGLSATSSGQVKAITAGGAGAGKAAVAGAVSMNEISNRTLSFLNDSAVNQAGRLVLNSFDNSLTHVIAGALSYGGKAGIGASVTLNDMDNVTQSYLKDSDVEAEEDISLEAANDNEIKSVAAALGASQEIAASASVSTNEIANEAAAYISGNKSSEGIRASKNIALSAKDSSDILVVTGELSGSTGAAGIGGSVSLNDIDNKLKAYVENARVEAKVSDPATADPALSGNLLLAAVSDAKILAIAAGGTGASKVGLAGTVTLNEIANTVDTHISGGSDIDAANGVAVNASDLSEIQSLAGAVVGAGKVSAGAAVATNDIGNTLSSYIAGSQVSTSVGDIALLALSNAKLKTISAAGAGAGTASLAGAVTLNDIENQVITGIVDETGVRSDVDAGGKVVLASTDSSSLDSLAGVVSGAGTASAGASVATNDIGNTLETLIQNSDVTSSSGSVELSATSSVSLNSITAGATGAGSYSLGGSVSLNDIRNKVKAHISSQADVKAQKELKLSAGESSVIKSLAGTVSGAGTASIGAAVATNDIGSEIQSYIDNAGAASLSDKVELSATTSSLIKTLSAGISGAGTATITGAVSLNDISNKVSAYIANTPGAGQTPTVTAQKNVNLTVQDTSTIQSFSGQIGGAGTAAIGGSASYNDISNELFAYTENAHVLSNEDNVALLSDSDSSITAISVGGSGGGTFAAAGSVAINEVENNAQAFHKGSTVAAGDNVTVIAQSDIETGIYGGTISGGGAAGIGGSAAVNLIGNTTKAFISQSSDISAKGMESVLVPKADSTQAQEAVQGVAVVALNQEEIDAFTANLSGGGTAGLAATVSVTLVEDDTQAFVDNSSVNSDNSGAADDQKVLVLASNVTNTDVKGGGVALGGAAGIGATADITLIDNNTKAYIRNSPGVQAKKAVEVKSYSQEDVNSAVVSGSGAGTAAVAGSVAVIDVDSVNEAFINNSQVESEGDLRVLAENEVELDVTAGSVSIGGVAGVGGSVVVSSVGNRTTAYIADSQTDALGSTEVLARSDEDVTTYAASGNLGGYLGAGGSVMVTGIETTTQAYIHEGSGQTQINQSSDDDEQDLKVNALNTSKVNDNAGVVAVGGLAGVGASIDVTTLKNTATASIGSGASVHAGRDVEVKAASVKNVDTEVLAFGGGAVGVQGAVAIINVGSAISSEGTDAAENTSSAVDDQIGGSAVEDQLGSSDLAASSRTRVDARTTALSVSDQFDPSAAMNQSTTAAIDGAAVSSRGNISVEAYDATRVDTTSGAGALGIAGIGGAVGVVSLENRTNAYVQDANLSAGDTGNVRVQASTMIVDSDVETGAGAAGAVGLGAAVSYIDSENQTLAYIGPNTEIDHAGDVQVLSQTSSDINAEAFGAAVGALAAGVVISDASEASQTKAYLDSSARIGDAADSSKAVQNLNIQAKGVHGVRAHSQAAAGGLLAGNGADATAEAKPVVQAYITDAAAGSRTSPNIELDQDIRIGAYEISDAKAYAEGVTVAALGAGVSTADATVAPSVSAFIGKNNVIQAGGDLLVESSNNYDEEGNLAQWRAYADATASAGALIGVASSDAEAKAVPVVQAYVGENASIQAGGMLGVLAKSYGIAASRVSGFCGGLAAYGSNTGSSSIASSVNAHLAKNISVEAGNVRVDAANVNDTYTNARAGAGGLVAGAAVKALTLQSNTTLAYIDTSDEDNEQKIQAQEDVKVNAQGTSILNAKADSTSAGVVGMSGGTILNRAQSTVNSFIGANNSVNAGRDLRVQAINWTRKDYIGNNITAGAGGVFGGAAGTSTSYLDNFTYAHVNGNTSAGSARTLSAGRDLTVSSENNVLAFDMGKFSSGGLVAVADVHSNIFNTNLAETSVGENSDLQAGNDVNVTSRAIANVGTVTNTSTWGLASSGDGKAEVKVKIDNNTNIGKNARIHGHQDVHIGAGEGPDNIQNYLIAKSEARSWVSGGIPLSDVVGYATLEDYNDIDLAEGSYVKANRDVTLNSLSGFTYVQGYARAKKKTYLLFGIPITIYSNGTRGTWYEPKDKDYSVTVNGTVESGLDREKTVFIDENEQITGNIGYSTSMINLLERLNAKIDLLDGKILEIDPENKYPNHPESDLLAALYTERDHLVTKRADYEGLPDVRLITIEDAATSGGQILINGNLKGSGKLIAPGNNFRIGIMNDSFAHLQVNNLEIPEDSSGEIFLNGRSIISHPTVEIDFGENLGRRIEIFNYVDLDDPDRVPDPDAVIPSDIVIDGDLTAYGGKIEIINNSGSIATAGDISADEIVVKAKHGSFTHEYTPGLYHAGTVMVGNTIYISAEILDINGTIQSGFPHRYITIPAFNPDTDLITRYGVENVIPTIGDENTVAVWDAENERIKLFRIGFSAGTIELFGEIVSTTGEGRIKSMDGYGQIDIVNDSARDLVVHTLDLSERLTGKVKITDTGKKTPENYPLTTIYTTEDNNVYVETGYKERFPDGAWEWHQVGTDTLTGTRNAEYEPYENAVVAEFDDWALSYKDVQDSWTHWWDAIKINEDRDVVFTLAVDAVTKTQLLNKYGVKADYPIAIEFTGNPDQGVVNITNTGASDIWINGSIENPSGPVNISNQGGSILGLNSTFVVQGGDLDFSAPLGSVGSDEQEIVIDTTGGSLSVLADGMVRLHEESGDLHINSLITNGDVEVVAEGSIWDKPDQVAGVVGKAISLTSQNGGIGTSSNALLMDSDGVVGAEAQDSIYLVEQQGDLLLEQIISHEGDVVLGVDGGVEDYHWNEALDDDTAEELGATWDDLELQDENRVEESIQDYKDEKKEEYQEEHLVDDGGTPTDSSDDVYDNTYDPNWEYVLTAEEESNFREGVWTEEELVNAKNVASVPRSGVAELLLERPNISGRNITVMAGGGVGSVLADETISQADIDSGNVTDDQKILLALAEKDDLTHVDADVIVQLKNDVDMEAAGSIDIRAVDHIYLGAETDVNIDTLSSNGELRLKIDGDIMNGDPSGSSINLIGNRLIIESTTGDVGAAQLPIVMDLSPDALTTGRALGDINLEERLGNFSADSLTSQEGSVRIWVSNGDADITKVTAPDEVQVAVNRGDLNIENLDPAFVNLHANNVNVENLNHEGAAGPLHLDVGGSSGSMADTVNMHIASSRPVVFDHLSAEFASIDAQTADLSLLDTLIGSYAEFNNSIFDVFMDNVTPGLLNCAVQIWSPGSPFSLVFSGDKRPLTSAHIVHYIGYEYIVNKFSTENSVTRLVDKFLSTSGYSRYQFAEETVQRSQNVNLFWSPLLYHEIDLADEVLYEWLSNELEDYYNSLGKEEDDENGA